LITPAAPYTPDPANPNLRFLEEVAQATAGVSRLEMCIQCGTCGGSCPSSADMDHTPRMLFAMIRAGYRDEALKSNTPWVCVSCYHCVVRCPQNVHIADVMYTLKGMAIRAKLYRERELHAPEFARTFVDAVENYGRSYEFGLATRYFLRHQPLRLPGMTPMGIGMLKRRRMSLKPRRIRGIAQLQAVLTRAKELEGVA
jgi:heterodisulfide reductase subunit C